MNERIKELIRQVEWSTDTTDSELKKFAELIVRECAQIGEDTDGNWNVKREILKHFGVEE